MIAEDMNFSDSDDDEKDEKIVLIENTFITDASFDIRFMERISEEAYNLDTYTLWGEQEFFNRHYKHLAVYPNGYSKEYKGCVSIAVRMSNHIHYFEGILIVSLIDSSGDLRFSRSFTIPNQTSSFFLIGNYISFKTLLSDPDDLIPDRRLRLLTYFRLTAYLHDFTKEEGVQTCFLSRTNPNISFKLFLDSPVAKKLAKESGFFRAKLGTWFKKRNLLPFPYDEKQSMILIAKLVMGINNLEFRNIRDMFKMFIIADKYDIPSAKETSVCFMKLYASIHGVDSLFTYTNDIVDEFEKELVEEQIKLLDDSALFKEIVEMDTGVTLKNPVYGHFWVYTHSDKSMNNEKAIFRRVVKRKEKEKVVPTKDFMHYESNEYDFYK